MNQKKYILFDLDGTLTDPKEGITKSVQYALRHYGIDVEDLDSLCPFIGPPLAESFSKFYGFPREQAVEAISVYREYFGVQGWRENVVYDGIEETLGALKAAGAHLLVATSKPELYAKRILEHFHLDSYFDWIGGADMEETRVRKADVIRYVIELAGLSFDEESISQMVMVGDREHDVLGAKEVGMDCVGVLYGFGDRNELEESGAAAIVESTSELKTRLLKLVSRG